ncbi:MAG: DNA translocase FtsK [Candidatus Ancaeobacter aquaticus]|nr:DNA translocase FtsK [Candidatus Ancaeobacter aquaticus]
MAIQSDEVKIDRSYVWSAIFFVISIFIALSFLSFNTQDIPFVTTTPNVPVKNYTGLIGAFLSFVLFFAFGLAAYSIPIFTLIISLRGLRTRIHVGKSVLGLLCMVMILSSFFGMMTFSFLEPLQTKINIVGAGGLFGYRIAKEIFVKFIGEQGALIILIPLFVASFLLYLNISIVELAIGLKDMYVRFMAFVDERRNKRNVEMRRNRLEREEKGRGSLLRKDKPRVEIYQGQMTRKEKKEQRVDAESGKGNMLTNIQEKFKRDSTPKIPSIKKEKKSRFEGASSSGFSRSDSNDDYQLPPLDLLNDAPFIGADDMKDDLENNSAILENTLKDFGIEVVVVEVHRGPVITTYEVQPAPGVKVNRITVLSDDIALALKAASIRIVAPIPGKSVVGIEVPNLKSSAVYLKDILMSDMFKESRAKLPLLLGKDVSGQALITDLTEMPHLLIAGTTGSGKTVCMNTIILSILYTMTPDEVKLIMIDPKKVELLPYKNIPHLVTPVVTDPKKATYALNWAVKEMEERYQLFANIGVRNIHGYNTRPDKDVLRVGENGEAIPKTIPYIVIVIDELNDLMMIAPADIENAITRLAQLSRAVGIHVILATQRPSVNVITGVIKANFPARISFQVASKIDSRTILDANGADKLLGKGDLLFLPPGTSKLVRAQGAFVSDKEINGVISFITEQAQAEFDQDIIQQERKRTAMSSENDPEDEIYDDAVEVVLSTKQASASVLQRKLRIGYARAARLIDMMEDCGIVGPPKGSKGRDILIKSQDQFEDDDVKSGQMVESDL